MRQDVVDLCVLEIRKVDNASFPYARLRHVVATFPTLLALGVGGH